MRHVRLVFALLLIVFSSAANANWIDTFPGGVPQENWTFASLPDGSSFTQSYFDGGLQLNSTTAVGGGGAAAVFGWVNETFSLGVRVRAVVNPNGEALSRNIGVLAQLDLGTLNGYALTIDADSIDLSKITGGSATNIETGAIQNFSTTASYIVELDAFGSQITGRVYDGNDSLLEVVSAIDSSPYTSGFAGIVAQREVGDSTLLGTFGTISAVPEPSSLLLASLGLLSAIGLMHFQRRRRLSA
ncbi:MAG: PEP-CTERM sorting domain-containing protein [Pirellulaceae bacterium]